MILENSNLDRVKLYNELSKIKTYFQNKKIDTENLEKILDLKINDDFGLYNSIYSLCNSMIYNNGLYKLIHNKKLVISLGGGAFMSKKIRSEVKKLSISFWLDVGSNILIKRLTL